MYVTLLCTIFYVYIWTCLSEINLYIYMRLVLDGLRYLRWRGYQDGVNKFVEIKRLCLS